MLSLASLPAKVVVKEGVVVVVVVVMGVEAMLHNALGLYQSASMTQQPLKDLYTTNISQG
jgi:hypothetical protein